MRSMVADVCMAKEGRRLAALLFLLGVFQIVGYYLAGAMVNGSGPMAIPQPDTLLYMQAARRIVEGHVFSFSANTLASTGTTSVLYPFVLSVPYALGARGDLLVSAGFVLNALFYLVFLFGWARVMCSFFSSCVARFVAVALLALSPQPTYCALSQSDIGLWMAVSGLFAASFIRGNVFWCAVFLVLGPWVRPEGMVIVVVFCVYAMLVRRRAEWISALAGLVSIASVFVLNIFISGEAQFSSVANKGYFTTRSFPQAVYMTVADAVQMVKGFVLGLSDTPPRIFYVIPVLGAVFVVWGFVSHRWERNDWRKAAVLFLAAIGSFAIVAMSGWQNTNMDRYIAWVFPLVVIFMTEGVMDISGRIASSCIRLVSVSLPFAYALCASVVMFFVYGGNSRDAAMIQEFGRDCESVMPPYASVGGIARCGIAYMLSDRRFAHLSGIYSPEFRCREQISVLEILKNEPGTRFDYWLFTPDTGFGDAFNGAVCRQVAVGPLGMELCKVDWSALENAAKVPFIDGMELVSRVDVGYEHDETISGYQCIQRYSHRVFDPFLKVSDCGLGGKMVEVARMVAGHDEMSVALNPGSDAKIVMRTCLSCDTVSRGAFADARVKYEIANPARLNLAVDGRLVGEVSYACATNGFSDVTFDIPGSTITQSPCTVALLGDHIACCYWFYQ